MKLIILTQKNKQVFFNYCHQVQVRSFNKQNMQDIFLSKLTLVIYIIYTIYYNPLIWITAWFSHTIYVVGVDFMNDGGGKS